MTWISGTPHLITETGNRLKNSYQTLMILSPKGIGRFWYVSCETPWDDPFFGDKTLCAETNVTFDLRAYKSYEGAPGE